MKKFISQEDMKIANIYEVLSLIRREGALTRKEIQDIMGLSWGGVSQMVSRLIELSFVREVKEDSPVKAGRRPCVIELNGDDNFVLGADVNKSGLYLEAVNLSGKTVCSSSGEAETSGKEEFLNSITALLDGAFLSLSGKNILAVGLAMQGNVDSEGGISEDIGIDGWRDVPIAKILTERYNVPVYIAHDPDCILAAGAGEKKADAVLIRIDRGLGMAVMKKRRLISGSGMLEIGDTVTGEGERIGDMLCAGKDILGALSLSLSNALILFDTDSLMLCGAYLGSHPDFAQKLGEKISGYMKREIKVTCSDVRNAAYGAAKSATEKFLSYID